MNLVENKSYIPGGGGGGIPSRIHYSTTPTPEEGVKGQGPAGFPKW